MVEKDPRKAADAFYWATRLDPTWAQPLYARRIALLMADPRLLIGYMSRNRGVVQSKEAKSIDSLELRALMLNPFLLRELDKQLLLAYLRALFEDELRRRGEQADGATTLRFDFFMESYLRSDASARVKAVLAVSERRLPEAWSCTAKLSRRTGKRQRPSTRSGPGSSTGTRRRATRTPCGSVGRSGATRSDTRSWS